ncbi:MAG: 30S ribosomal protein S12 methylthiotransferase RimO [Clostridia bacterium]
MIKIGFIHLGCAKNQIDSELMLALLKQNDCELLDEYCDADVVVINTCGFIESAKVEAIENIVEVIALKNEGRVGGIVVCGCLSERYKEEIEEQFPEVDCFLGTGSYKSIVTAVKAAYNKTKYCEFAAKEAHIIEGDRIITTQLPTAYIKISEGCDNCCSYCAIPLIRGKFRSRTIESIVAEAKHLASIGVRELIVIAQDTTRYGEDIYNKKALPELLQKLAEIREFVWIRVMYLYPDRVTDELLYVIAKNDNIINYIEMPIQHASGKILKDMNRMGNEKTLLATIQKIRDTIPNVVLRTTIMVGFPGETENDFEILYEFLKK